MYRYMKLEYKGSVSINCPQNESSRLKIENIDDIIVLLQYKAIYLEVSTKPTQNIRTYREENV